MTRRDYDTIVIGGGPAGSTTATVLAQHGRRVLVLEREVFPRYHIGESLMPYTWFTFERLGVLSLVQRVCLPEEIQRAVRVDCGQGVPTILFLRDD